MSADAILRIVMAAGRAGVEPGGIVRRAGGPAALLSAGRKRLNGLGVPATFQVELGRARDADPGEFRRELADSETVCVTAAEPAYPAGLRDLSDPPLAVFVRGRLAPLPPQGDRSAVAIVGARRPTDAGLRVARRLGAFSAGAGVAVVSGMALGIDAAAHGGALDAGGLTVAVLGCGTDIAYPRRHRGLYERILEHGLAVSEYPPGTAPAPWRFPARNRLIAALAGTLVVVEARARSGALITADHALDIGRDVVAVPGAAGSAAAAGTNGLIKAGAGLVEDEADLSVWLGVDPPAAHDPPADARGRPLLAALAEGAAYADDLARAAGLRADAVSALLSRLELDGWVVRDDAGRYTLTRPWQPTGTQPSTATGR